MKEVHQGFCLNLKHFGLPDESSRGLLHAMESSSSHFDPNCGKNTDHYNVISPAYEARFLDFDFRNLDSLKTLALFRQTLVGVADIAESDMVHLDIRRCNMVLLSLTPPEARLASFNTLHKAEGSDLQEKKAQDLHMWSVAIAQAKLNEEGFAWRQSGSKLRKHAQKYPDDGPLCDLLLRAQQTDPKKGSITAQQALTHPCWEILTSSQAGSSNSSA